VRSITAACLRFRFIVVPLAGVLLILGVNQIRSTPVDVLPEYLPPTVQIQTEALGLSASEVEQLVTVPLEADLLNGVAYLDEIRSESVNGLSSIDLVFEPGTDIMAARQLVQERMTQAHALPNVSKPPLMLQPLSSTGRVMVIGLSAKDLSLTELSVLARWKIKPALLGVPGVANVAIWGQRERQLQVQVDPDKMRAHGVSLVQVMKTTGNALWVSPLSFVEASTPGTGGFIDTPNQRLSIQHILPIRSAEDLAEVSVEPKDGVPATQGTNVKLSDVANVVEDHQPLIGDAVVNDDRNLMLVVEKFPGESTLGVTQRVEAAIENLKPGLTGITVDTSVYRPAGFIESGLTGLAVAGLIGLLLVLLVVIGLIASWRAAVVALVTIPLSLASALFVLHLRGATFNAMVLAGLVMAVGVVVGDAVTDADTIGRRLRGVRKFGPKDRDTPGNNGPMNVDHASDIGPSSEALVARASREVRTPLVVGTLIIVVITTPLVLLEGVTNAFADPLVLSYLLTVLISTIVALTVTPALSLLLSAGLLSAGKERAPRRPGKLYRWYIRTVKRVVARPVQVMVAAGLAVLLALAVLPVLAQSALPSTRETDVQISWDGYPGTSYPEMARITAVVSRELRSVPGVRNVGGHLGRAITSDKAVSVNSGELWVSIAPDADYDRTTAAIRSVVSGYPGLTHNLRTHPDQQLEAARTGITSDLAVRVFGQDAGILRTKAEEIRAAMAQVHGIADARVERQIDEPTIEVQVDLGAAQRHGIKPGDVRRAAATMLAGVEVGSLFEEQKVFEVVVWSAEKSRSSLTSVENLRVDKPDGGQVRLGDVADVRIVPSPNVIKRNAVSRYIDVVADVSGRSLGEVADDVETRIKSIQFPIEHHAEVLGEAEQRRGDELRVLGAALAAIVLAFLLLQATLGSWRLATLALLTLPVAASGAFLAMLLGSRELSLVTIGAVLAVVGIATRQCLLLLKRYQALEQEGRALGTSLVVHGASERLASTLVVPLATAVALIPLLFVDFPGSDAVQSVVQVVLGGLATSALLYLFGMPSLYMHFSGPARVDQRGE
jgi:Cu/Ag efflux pump CusA